MNIISENWPPCHHIELDITIHLCAEGIFLVRLKVRGGGAPQLAVAAAGGGAGVVRLALVDKGKHAGLAVGVATVHRSGSVCVWQTWHHWQVWMVLVVFSKRKKNLSTVGTVRERLLTPLLAADPAAQAGADHLRGSLALHPALAHEVAGAGVGSAGTLLVRVGSRVWLVDGRLNVGDHTGASAWR